MLSFIVIGAAVFGGRINHDILIAAEPALTIYNQNFAVVRETIPLDLKAGINEVDVEGMTAYLEPASVVLRDPLGRQQFRILEQNYRADPVSQELLLALSEGKTLQFETYSYGSFGREPGRVVEGRILRSGYSLPRREDGFSGRTVEHLIEVDGQLRFGLPGTPIFPALAADSILTPTLNWVIESEAAASFTAELSYLTDQLSWKADYNLVLPETGDVLDLVGWVTIENQSGKSFADAQIKLMAGDVAKVTDPTGRRYASAMGGYGGSGPPGVPVTEKAFDEFHLYTLQRPTTLSDAQKKQVEFVRAADVKSAVTYLYDGADLGDEGYWWNEQLNMDSTYGTKVNKKVSVTREFANTEANSLGVPLPKGRVRVYRRDADGRLEFTGENEIDHTPRDEPVRLKTGFAFDLVGDRVRTHVNIHMGDSRPTYVTDPATGAPISIATLGGGGDQPPFVDESFEISVRNRKREPVTIRVIEHLYRGGNWEIQRPSQDFKKVDARTIEFLVVLEPGEEKQVQYTAHYTWR